MDTTKTLKSRLRDRLVQWRTEAESARKAADAERERLYDLFRDIPDAERARLGADRTRRVSVYILLSRLAGDEEIGLLAAQLGERRPLKVTGSIWPMDESVMPDSLPPVEWVIARPGRESPTLPQSIGDPLIVWDIVFDAVIPEWIEHLGKVDSSADAVAVPKLGKQARAVLDLLYRDKAFDEAHACKLSRRAPTQLKYESAKSPDTKDKYAKNGLAELKRLKLAEAVPSVGTWLTPEGRALAESFWGQKPR